MPDDEDLERQALELGERWEALLAEEPEGVRRTFSFLAAMAMIRAGACSLIYRGVRDGRPVLIATDPYSEQIFQLDDPELGAVEEAAVADMARVLGVEGNRKEPTDGELPS